MQLHGKGIETEENFHYTHSKPELGSGSGEFITYSAQLSAKHVTRQPVLIYTLYRCKTLLKIVHFSSLSCLA